MFILGFSAFYHDSAACIIHNGDIVAAAQEERFTRIKHDASFPAKAINYCMEEAGINPSQIDAVVFYEKPFLKFERLLETYLAFAPIGFNSFRISMQSWIKDKLFQKQAICRLLSETLDKEVKWSDRLLFSGHHLSHAASAFFPSPYKTAAILTIDGVGEWTTTSIAIGKSNNIDVIREMKFPHSLGLLYSAFTYYVGFKVNSGEYKLMGLAPYGTPKYVDLIYENLIDVKDDGSFQLDMRYFDFATGFTMTNNKFERLFGGVRRNPEAKITQKHMDLAASIQKVTEQIILKIGKKIALDTKEKNLCLAGGVALNCVANGVLLREKIFENIWVQPASGDAGGALGAALACWHMHFKKERKIKPGKDAMLGAYLGPEYSAQTIEEHLIKCGAKFHKLAEKDLIERVSNALVESKAVGWMQGRMEFGPRALGARSIIADPRSPRMQKQLNLKVKFRESFRPFAPSVLRKHVAEWFDHTEDSPYMLLVAEVKNSKRITISQDEDLALWHREAKRCTVFSSCDYSRGLFRKNPNGSRRN